MTEPASTIYEDSDGDESHQVRLFYLNSAFESHWRDLEARHQPLGTMDEETFGLKCSYDST